MTYHLFHYDFNRERIHNILEHRVENWIKQVEIAQKANVSREPLDCLLYLLALDLRNYQKSPLQQWDEELIQKAKDLLGSTDIYR